MILVTGASSGIGEACAREFASNRRDLVLVARRLDRVQQLAAELRSVHGIEAHAFALDVRDRSAVEEFVRSNDALLSKVRVLVNNAGLARGLSLIQEGKLDDWEAMIDTNVKGFLYVTRGLLPHLIRAGADAQIVNIGSVAGRWNYPRGNVYCATKHAVRSLNEALRMDLNGTGVRVTEIAPGMVETEFSLVRMDGDAEKAKAVYAGLTPLTARDVAESVVWCVNRPRHVNIQELVIYPTDQASPTINHRR